MVQQVYNKANSHAKTNLNYSKLTRKQDRPTQ